MRLPRKGNIGKIKSLIKCSDRQDYNHERRERDKEKKKESIKQVSRSSEMKMKTRKKK